MLPFLATFLLASLGAPEARAKMAPDIEWETVWTEHFRVHFPIAYRKLASRLITYLEEAYPVLSKDLHWQLQSRADIVVRSDIDQPNGLTSVFPYNEIIFQAMPFLAQTSIGEYDDWIRTLAYHELTHLVANDTTTGVFDVGRAIFGTVAKVNLYQPVWLVEGLAVYEETALSDFGRGRSVYGNMVLRAAQQEGMLDQQNVDPLLGVTLDRLNDGAPFWPGGYTAYLYGYIMEQMVAVQGGPGAPGKISYDSGGRVPFFINDEANNALGEEYYALWDQALAKVKSGVDADLALIHKHPVDSTATLTTVGRSTGAPVPSEDGTKVYFVRDSYRTGRGLSVLDRASGQVRDLSYWDYDGLTTLKREGRFLLYSKYNLVDEFKMYTDVYAMDPETRREIQLTHGARAMDADASPDFEIERGHITGGAIAYVKNLSDGNQGLAIWDGATERILYSGKRFERFSAPAWGRGPLAGWVVFAEKVNGRNERLSALNVKTGKTSVLFAVSDPTQRVVLTAPSWTRKGDLLFTSSESGVFNVWRLDAADIRSRLLEGGAIPAAARVTNAESGIFSPVEDRAAGSTGKILGALYSARGFDVAEITLQSGLSGTEPALSTIREKIAPTTASEKSRDVIPEETPDVEPHDYSVFPSIWPKYWNPYLQVVTDGWNFGVQTAGYDALQIHSYSLEAAYDTRANFPLFQIGYAYNGLYPTIQFSYVQSDEYLGIFGGLSNRYDNGSLQLVYPIGFWSVGFGATLTDSHFLDQGAESGGLSFSLGYSDMKIFPDSIDPSGGESGHNVSLQLTGYITGQEQYSYLSATYEQRIPLGGKQHFFRFLGSATKSTNLDIPTLYFVGGGESVISQTQNYLLRGYPAGIVYGRSITTVNFEYWFPIKDVFRGHGTMPLFFERAKALIFADTGSSEFVNGVDRDYQVWPVGVGAHILADVNVGYRIPVTLAVGLDWGLSEQYGGEKQVVLGLMGQVP